MEKKKMGRFSIFYIVSAVLVTLLSVVSFTFAWYVKSTTHSIGIVFAKPVILEIDPELKQVNGEVEVSDVSKLLPGSKVSVNLGFKLGNDLQQSSPAYVRAKLVLRFDDIYDENNNPIIWNSSKYIKIDIAEVTNQVGYTWEEVNFSKSGKDDKWWVLKYDDYVALQAQHAEYYTFMKGNIELSTAITNDFAEKQIHVLFTVDAIQVDNVQNPLADPLNSVWASE